MNATLVAQIINFLILVGILTKIAYRPILAALEERRKQIEQSLTEAEQARVLAEAVEKQCRQQLAEARSQARAIIDEAIALGEKSQASMVQTAREENERLLAKAQAEIEHNYQQALQRLQAEVAVMAVAAAEKIIEKNLDHETNAGLVQKFIADFTKEKYGELV